MGRIVGIGESARLVGRGVVLVLLMGLLAAVPARARGEGGRVPVVVLLVSGVGYEDLRAGRPMAALRPLEKRGMLALLEPAADGEPTEAAAYLSVGAGVPVAAPENGGRTILEAGLTRTMADIAQDAYPFAGLEGEVVARGYRRRYREYPPLAATMLHLGLPALRDGQGDAATAARIGALGDALKRAGLRVAVFGDWRALLVGMDKRGAAYAGGREDIAPERLSEAVRDADVTLAAAATPRTLRQYVAALKDAPNLNLIIAAVAPPLVPGAKPPRWASPGFLLCVGPAFPARTVPVSRTTHLPGLVSALDLAPTVAALTDAPFDGGTGTSLTTARKIKSRDAFASLATLDRQIAARDKIGGIAGRFALTLAILALLASLPLMLWKRTHESVLAHACLWFAAALPAALGTLLARRWLFAPLALLLLLTAALFLYDFATDQTILHRSAFYDASFDAARR